MKTPDISTIHETVLHGDMRFHLMVHEFASDPSRSERVTSHWHEEYELLFLTEGNGTAHVNRPGTPDFCRRYPVFQFRRSPLHL